MGSDKAYDEHRSRRRKMDDEDESYSRDRRKHHRDDDEDLSGRRDRSRERHRRRSRSPRRQRSRSRDRIHGRHREELSDEETPRYDRDLRDESSGHYKDRRRKRSPEEDRSRRKRQDEELDDESRSAVRRGRPLPSQADSFALTKGEEALEKPKEKPNFGTTGALAAASNSVVQADGSTIALKYHEPPEARKPPPKDQWKLFVFKGSDIVDTVDLSNRSCWLVGRETAVVDLAAEHPSISKQHAVIQFRYTEKRNEFGDKIGRVKPYLIDLESANGTKLNKEKVPDSRYLELRDKDMIQFGHSTREYVLMLAPRD